MVSVMPVRIVICGGIDRPGSTRVANSPSTSPARTLTAPISVIASVSDEPPVVSRSTTTKVISRSGSPSSSKLRWVDVWVDVWVDTAGLTTGSTVDRRLRPPVQGAPDGDPNSGRFDVISAMDVTLERRYDSPAERRADGARRPDVRMTA